ncbi:MAG: hypothetical protein EHM49_07545 [Deltaproteobacteria bacterium]|nr:MAG: hypothetical protein EHM49_09110 [Deltaproteobacteria bacterium]RPI51181.1 MAG: hypothetical protein EHM49_07545 [Deltaproteobacteria bacterium]
MITKHVAEFSKSVKAKPFGYSCLAALTALELSAEPGGGDDGGRQNRPCLRRGSAQRAGIIDWQYRKGFYLISGEFVS